MQFSNPSALNKPRQVDMSFKSVNPPIIQGNYFNLQRKNDGLE